MEKVSRNSPCPCGSGKKYKRCCSDRILMFPHKNDLIGDELKSSSEMLQIIKGHFEKREFSSIEEMNAELNILTANQNSLAKSPFLGLAPNQLHQIIHSPFTLKNEIFDFECEDTDELRRIPLIEHALYILNTLKEQGSIKATQKGNLSKAFVVELYHRFFADKFYCYAPSKEADLFPAVRLRFLLENADLIVKKSTKIILTKKGEKIINEDNILELFTVLIDVIFNEWNWEYGDRYSELGLIQDSAIFNLYILKKKANDWISGNDLGKIYNNAFPALANELVDSYFGGKNEVTNIFYLRFLVRICLYLGILESKERDHLSGAANLYRVTPLFNKIFKFRY